jgi:hypothetical protein
MFGAEAPVTSAVKASGFDKVAGFNGRNTVLVLVESLGSLTDKEARSRIVAPIYDPRVTAEYDVTEGRITYYGSTTWGEMRELCNTRKPYKEFTESDGVSSCLPERFIKHGYATTEGWSRDVSEDVAHEVLEAARDRQLTIPNETRYFLERHLEAAESRGVAERQ